jgi:hypothetical protein
MVDAASSTDGVNFTTPSQLGFGSNFQPSMTPNASLNVLEIAIQDPVTADLDTLIYVGGSGSTGYQFARAMVEAPAIAAYGQNLVFAWLGTDMYHTINVCLTSASQQSC